jgi:hypothetical protein
MPTRVIVVDIGSVSTSKFAWAAFDHPSEVPVKTGDDPES